MIEGQEDVTWEQWVVLAEACETSGLEGLFRSDHYLSIGRGGRAGSLDAWATLAGLAGVTERIRLGTLVSPVTFRPASVLAKNVVTVDHLSGGRVELGIGAGWFEAEHDVYGFPFMTARQRVQLLAEQVETIVRHWTTDERVWPKPVQQPRPPLILGGSARRGTVEPAVRYADEYNTIFVPADECRERRRRLDEACERAGRDPASLAFSLMTACVVGSDQDEVAERIRRRLVRAAHDGDVEEVVRNPPEAWIAGTVDEVVEQLRRLESAGIERVFCQHLDHEDVEMVHVLGEIAAAVR
jgi:alkanesulfonate monooxygenase SsuD/methylene tetrahydromethanopterin reductase-like flavin-dependent oxidoreductase (luciferase family)